MPSMVHQKRVCLHCLMLAIMLTPLAFAQDLSKDVSVDISLRLDQTEVPEDGPISGDVTLMFKWKDTGGAQHDTAIRLSDPCVVLVLDRPLLPLTLMEGSTIGDIPRSPQVGTKYMRTFTVSANALVKRALANMRASVPLAAVGHLRIKAVLESRPSWSAGTHTGYPNLLGDFASGWSECAVNSSSVATATAQQVVAALADASTEVQSLLLTFYAAMKYPLSSLPGFSTVESDIRLAAHDDRMRVCLTPRQHVRLVNVDHSTHTFTCFQDQDPLLDQRSERIEIEAPREEGLFHASCGFHKKPWGWIVVRDAEPKSSPILPTGSDREQPASRVPTRWLVTIVIAGITVLLIVLVATRHWRR